MGIVRKSTPDLALPGDIRSVAGREQVGGVAPAAITRVCDEHESREAAQRLNRVESVSQMLGYGVHGNIRPAIRVRRALVRRSRFTDGELGTCSENSFA